jgi:hypothetical protein
MNDDRGKGFADKTARTVREIFEKGGAGLGRLAGDMQTQAKVRRSRLRVWLKTFTAKRRTPLEALLKSCGRPSRRGHSAARR